MRTYIGIHLIYDTLFQSIECTQLGSEVMVLHLVLHDLIILIALKRLLNPRYAAEAAVIRYQGDFITLNSSVGTE